MTFNGKRYKADTHWTQTENNGLITDWWRILQASASNQQRHFTNMG